MSDKELEEYINKIEPNFDSHLEKGTIEMSNEYYNLLEEKMARLINKNQELNQKYLNAVTDYEQEKFTVAELKKQLEESDFKIANLTMDKIELKKQLEESKDNYNCLLNQKKDFEYIMSKQVDYQGQQKEFIHYLTSYIELLSDKPDLIEESEIDLLKEILSKYKETIGVSNEN